MVTTGRVLDKSTLNPYLHDVNEEGSFKTLILKIKRLELI